jgi:hypothetical protein
MISYIIFNLVPTALIFFFYCEYLDVHFLASLFPAVIYYHYCVANEDLKIEIDRDPSYDSTIEWFCESLTMACTAGIFVFYYWQLGVHFSASFFAALLFYLYEYTSLELRKKIDKKLEICRKTGKFIN